MAPTLRHLYTKTPQAIQAAQAPVGIPRTASQVTMAPPHDKEPILTGIPRTASQIAMPPPRVEKPVSTSEDPDHGTAPFNFPLTAAGSGTEAGTARLSASLPPRHQEQKQTRLEGPYLIHPLDQVMKAAPSYLGVISPPFTSSTTL
ncbi:unnamed protein product [Zymoseptoria tritici ST99CH_1E4]|uniref:Uncharacterized protein n=1 Tax=Zymoseptoria tritici ST99CH_1E4 TaxID=1276532 RepID=A0A2H1H9C1_ZYMTR|nr:unnamed protein product [Zymoseptoria tritici ST99CH_1E4]